MEARRQPMEGKEEWLRRYTCEPVFSSRHPNADKVCFADPELREEGYKFSRVHPIHESKILRCGREPVEGSPSLPIWSSHTKHAQAITSICRLKISFRLMQSGKVISYLGTGFRISNDIILSAGHLFNQDEEDEEDAVLIEAVGCRGSYVSMSCFDDDACFHLATIAPPTDWPSNLLTCGLKGLTIEGSDLAFARAEGDMCPTFLLPMSPSFLHREGEKVLIFCLSYPAIDAFLNQAEKELHVCSEMDTWASYESMIAAEMEAEILKVADGSALTEEDNKKIKLEIKRRFLEELKSTFDCLHTGMLTCAVGVLIYDATNPFSIGTTCSLLNGSSGGPICTPLHTAYFIAVHSGGSDADNLNFATSTDNPKFVSEYMELVLPQLPPPTNITWKDLDLVPFFGWLSCHKESAILPHTVSTSLWFEEASKHCGPPTSLKRKRCDLESS